MPADFWDEDDRPAPAQRPGWRWWQVVGLGVIALLALFGIAAALVPEKLADGWIGWQVRQLRKGILDGRLSPEALRGELRSREGGHHLALRLARDEDPRVRAAVADTLASWGTPATKREPGDPFHMPTNRLHADDEEALNRLLDDPDPAVRASAIRAVSAIEEARGFEDRLLHILESGPVPERLIVCEYLAHWNGAAVRRTFADPRQPKEVRLAALKSTERYGWREVLADREGFRAAMTGVAAEGDPELRKAALDALTRDAKGE